MCKTFLPLLTVLLLAGCQHAINESSSKLSPYVGETGRTIKSLSAEQTKGLLAGEGLGYAKAAELNGYPGPKHVMDMAEQLELTDTQQKEVTSIFEQMQKDAKVAGRELIEAESALDGLFAQGEVTASDVERLTAEIAIIQGEVRRVHLVSHLGIVKILTPNQVESYNTLRGYSEGASGESNEDHMKHEHGA